MTEATQTLSGERKITFGSTILAKTCRKNARTAVRRDSLRPLATVEIFLRDRLRIAQVIFSWWGRMGSRRFARIAAAGAGSIERPGHGAGECKIGCGGDLDARRKISA